MNVRHSFSIKIIFYDKMDLRLFIFVWWYRESDNNVNPTSFCGIRFQGNFPNPRSIERDQLHEIGWADQNFAGKILFLSAANRHFYQYVL